MAQSNRERVGTALELVSQGLAPFVERTCRSVQGPEWFQQVTYGYRDNQLPREGADGQLTWDIATLLLVMWDQWNAVFRTTLGQFERTLVSELRDVRNKWAHQEPFTADDTYRALDTAQRLLLAVSAGPQAAEIERGKQEVLRLQFEEQTRKEVRRVAAGPLSGPLDSGLRPWREAVTPHPDIAAGRYQDAEFMADLAQVARGEGGDEYRDPRAFFQRTFLTAGLHHLLSNAAARLSGKGGDPVVELQTNFGGGKTHSMLALYHLFSGVSAADLAGVETVLQSAGVAALPKAERAVLVGNDYSPGQPHTKPDGTVIHTTWGELAWQLLGREGYALVAEADRTGTSPGAEVLRQIFETAAPCLILIDEWVVYVRQLYNVSGLPAGSFDANLSFAQALTEAVKSTPRTLLVASIPASDNEIGGEGGKEAVVRLRNVLGRVEAAWRPASTEEGFEIVRRRLFQPIQHFAVRDAVARSFTEFYRNQSQEFPPNCGEAAYERRIQAAYPIHPELFDRLFGDWSQLDRFQRTRGVLRLMAAVIHALWERQDASPLILPASVPIDDPKVQYELTHYLDEQWVPIIEKDVDGPQSLPLQLDRDHPNLGRFSAARRVARTIYLGSAPTLHSANRGIEDRQIKLGCAQPREAIATFGDALRRLAEQSTHLYVQDRRYWYSTQPSVARLAQDRAAQMDRESVLEEIERWLRGEQNSRGSFARVHACPGGSGDISDDREARLVILRPGVAHTARDATTTALGEARAILAQRGNNPRYNQNTLVFLAADRARLEELEQAVRQHHAWKSIEAEHEILNLDAFSRTQAKTRRDHSEEAIRQRIPETYCWLLVPQAPDQPGERNPDGDAKWVTWREIRLQGQDALAVRASRKLENDGLLYKTYAGSALRVDLDRVPLWRGDHVSVKQLAGDFAQYLYLPRLRDPELLLAAVCDGAASLTWERETFAYADRYDEAEQRYVGLKAAQQITPALDGLLVKPAVAAAQFAADAAQRQQRDPAPVPSGAGGTYQPATASQSGNTVYEPRPAPAQAPATPAAAGPSRFYAVKSMDATRLVRDADELAKEVIQHLTKLVGAQVEITLEIQAKLPQGAPEDAIRTVSENCRTLKFNSFGFEE